MLIPFRGRRHAVLVVALAGVSLGAVAAIVAHATISRVTASDAAGQAPTPNLRYLGFSAADGTVPSAVTWSGDGQLWVVATNLGGDGTLYEIDPSGSVEGSWKLPLPLQLSVNTYVGWEGSMVWIAANYTLVAFDTRGHAWAHAESLAPEAPHRTPTALQPNALDPGTWVNGLGIEDRGVLFTRHNVLASFRASAQADAGVEDVLPAPAAGMRMVAGRPAVEYALGADRQVIVGGQAQAVLALGLLPGSAADDLAADYESTSQACGAWVSPEAGEIGTMAVGKAQALRVPSLGWPNFLAANGQWLALAAPDASLLVRVDCSTDDIQQLRLPARTVADARADPSYRGPASSVPVPITFVSGVRALAISSSGTIAIVDDAGRLAIVP